MKCLNMEVRNYCDGWGKLRGGKYETELKTAGLV
jgi:hypothetical protein